LAAALASCVLLVAVPAPADEYESEMAGHPLRFAAYVVHPVGVILETLIVKPAHWLVSQGPLKKFFGHEDGREFFGHEDGRGGRRGGDHAD
jgi:hypothetical protein